MLRFSWIFAGIGLGFPAALFLIDYFLGSYYFSVVQIIFTLLVSPFIAFFGIIAGVREILNKRSDRKAFLGLVLNLLTIPFILLIYKYALENM
ncbi:MAG: hypothetical protein H7Y04_09255 [Verrucomicrobia bacterium]|nr:hypothetical protein [Cytophagales bacterium]